MISNYRFKKHNETKKVTIKHITPKHTTVHLLEMKGKKVLNVANRRRKMTFKGATRLTAQISFKNVSETNTFSVKQK